MLTEDDIEMAFDILLQDRGATLLISDVIRGNTMAKILSLLHTHAEIQNDIDPNRKVYTEDDVIKLLIALGAPAPQWE
jgi:hypothetical protein